MAGMALKGQYNFVSIMVPPRGVYERKVFTKEQKKTMFIAEKLNAAFLKCRWIISINLLEM